MICQYTAGSRRHPAPDALLARCTPLLHELEAKGLAMCEVLPADRRSNAVRLTATGHAAVSRALALHERLEKRITSCLGEAGRAQRIEQLHKLEAL